MSGISDGKHKTRGIELGEAVAAHYLALRANDHIFDSPIWVQPTPGPGVFEPVAPTPPVDYKLVFVPPYTFDIAETPSYFPPPPPALTSDQYTDRKSTRLNSSHTVISYAVFCLKKKKK